MATPKKKVSRSRRNMRRFAGGNKLLVVTSRSCPECNEPTRPHAVCKCGFYAKRKVFTKKVKPTAEPAA